MSAVVDVILYGLAGAVIGGVVAGVGAWVMDRRAAAGAARLRAQIERAHASARYAPIVPAEVEAEDFDAWERELA